MKIELTKDEVGTLLKVLEDYKEVLLKRIAQESKNGSKTLADFGLKRPPQSWQYVEVKE